MLSLDRNRSLEQVGVLPKMAFLRQLSCVEMKMSANEILPKVSPWPQCNAFKTCTKGIQECLDMTTTHATLQKVVHVLPVVMNGSITAIVQGCCGSGLTASKIWQAVDDYWVHGSAH